LPVSQGLALSYDFKKIVISCLKSFSQLLVCFLPIGGQIGFSSGNSLAIPIANPPDFGASSPIDNTVVLACSRHLHLLFEGCAECFEIRLEKPDVATHYAEMGNLLPLNPKIHSLSTDAKKLSGFTNRMRAIVRDCRDMLFRACDEYLLQ
jgi:hypothetical protein